VRRKAEAHPIVHIKNFRVVAVRFCQLSHLINKAHGLFKIGKLPFAPQASILVLPAGQPFQFLPDGLFI